MHTLASSTGTAKATSFKTSGKCHNYKEPYRYLSFRPHLNLPIPQRKRLRFLSSALQLHTVSKGNNYLTLSLNLDFSVLYGTSLPNRKLLVILYYHFDSLIFFIRVFLSLLIPFQVTQFHSSPILVPTRTILNLMHCCLSVSVR